MLDPKELERLTFLLGKIDDPHAGLPQPIFDALLKIVPFVACELAVMDGQGGVLLTWREDKWYQGWHFPGGLIRFREKFEERVEQVAQKELGIKMKKCEFLFAKDYSQSRRGHVVSLVFRCEPAEKPKSGQFFREMPQDIISDHVEFWEKIQKFIK